MKNFINDFKTFLRRGNVIDLAIAFVIGGAFSAIVTSLVGNVIMPPIGLILNKVDFSNLFIVLHKGKVPGPYLTLAAAKNAGAVTLNYGLFVTSIISFLIVALVVFMFVRAINRLYPSKPEAPISKTCPFCAMEIPLAASRCPNCTSQLGQ